MLGTVDSRFSEPDEPNTYQLRFCAASCLREYWAPGSPVCPHPAWYYYLVIQQAPLQRLLSIF